MFFKSVKIRQRVTIPLQMGQGEFFTFKGLRDSGEHIAIGFGDWEAQSTPLVRMHSECLTGDVFTSSKCDCGEQLQEAIAKMQVTGGILLYLRQEGRGIGLYNKLDAYALQAKGMDTYEANQKLGFADDLRKYNVAAEMLKAMKKVNIRLLSNNPDKSGQLKKLGINIKEEQSTGVFVKVTNSRYLEAKALKTGHRIDLSFLNV
jgi:GTP cyclohydrolase II